jgi:quinol monooxygenase YgiN
LNDKLIAFIRRQKIFFVATAPLSINGSVNVSPKGYDSLAIIDTRTVAYVDLGGSGIETYAHLRENGRITLMFCAFDGPANILRLYGRGETCSFDQPGFVEKMKLFPAFERARSVVTVHIQRVADSCGWGVPFFDFRSERDQLSRWVVARTHEEWVKRRYEANAVSIDGLPGVSPYDEGGELKIDKFGPREVPGNRILIVGTVRLPAGSLDKARSAMRAMITASRAENGCIEYSYSEDALESGLVHVKEIWENRQALRSHFQSDHIRSWRSTWGELQLSDRKLVLYEVANPEAI